ncbi:hypothetical protein DVS28_b0036 (plasmid) [Euzebya pacifica]|uniref:Peptidase M50B-like n=1 Tax=Euzebya pacifica TaxID=1608957 RepID=A0A346Y5Q9_9ACTN|nr:hypothetical protein [Euzebya pacifica]AXV09806.1 hypothetical protein DVS28_b0036 [Euzebya pacifica]
MARRRKAPWWTGPSLLCDLTIGLLRIPTVLGCVLLAWPLSLAAARLAIRAAQAPAGPTVLLLVATTCTAAGIKYGRHRTGFGHLGTLEHEAAHAIVALATFHPITGASVRRDSGHVTYASVTGRGNWLIGIAPYILPLVPLAAIIGTTAAGLGGSPLAAAAVGAAAGWHILATLAETRGHQPDLQRLGRPTWVPVVLAVNTTQVLLTIGWAAAGTTGAADVITDLHHTSRAILDPVVEHIAARIATS